MVAERGRVASQKFGKLRVLEKYKGTWPREVYVDCLHARLTAAAVYLRCSLRWYVLYRLVQDSLAGSQEPLFYSKHDFPYLRAKSPRLVSLSNPSGHSLQLVLDSDIVLAHLSLLLLSLLITCHVQEQTTVVFILMSNGEVASARSYTRRPICGKSLCSPSYPGSRRLSQHA